MLLRLAFDIMVVPIFTRVFGCDVGPKPDVHSDKRDLHATNDHFRKKLASEKNPARLSYVAIDSHLDCDCET